MDADLQKLETGLAAVAEHDHSLSVSRTIYAAEQSKQVERYSYAFKIPATTCTTVSWTPMNAGM